MRIGIPETIEQKLNIVCKYTLKEVEQIGKSARLTKEERAIIKQYVKGAYNFDSRLKDKNLGDIKPIVQNAQFRAMLANRSRLYPVLGSIFVDLSLTAYLFGELQKGGIWGEENQAIRAVLTSQENLSQSCRFALIAYIKSQRPSDEEIKGFEEEVPFTDETTGETLTHLSNPCFNFYARLSTQEKNLEKDSYKNEFAEFARLVMLYIPEERENLYKVVIEDKNGKGEYESILTEKEREQIISSADFWGKRHREEDNDLIFDLPKEESKTEKKGASEYVKIVYDMLNTISSPALIQDEIASDNNEQQYLSIPVVNYLLTRKGFGEASAGRNGYYKAVATILMLVSGNHDLVSLNEDNTEYEASIYKLYKIISPDNEPTQEDLEYYLAGLRMLTCPHMAEVKGEGENKKNTSMLQQYTPLHIMGNFIVFNEDRKKLPKAEQSLYKQIIRFEIDPICKYGFRKTVIEDSNGEEKVIFTPHKFKNNLLVPPDAIIGKNSKETILLAIVKTRGTKTQKGHMEEAELLSRVFEYKALIDEARKKDENNEPCDKTFTVKNKEGEKETKYFETWEQWRKRDITLHKDRDRKTLEKLFKGLISDKIITSFTKSGKSYEWKLATTKED